MTIEEIIQSALDGKAVLFLGAGFSTGAQNIKRQNFKIGKEFCRELIENGNIDIAGEEPKDIEDLGYISQRYLDSGNTARDLINLIKQNYTCYEVLNEHEIIAKIKWKKVYTTNYDDVMEIASRNVGILREPVVATKLISDIYSIKNSVIHINGYVGDVNEDNLFTTFKLTEESYQNRTIPDSDWAVALHNDIINAKSIIFIGYSLAYDLELKQIFSQDKTMKNKSLFVTYNPSKREKNNMESFGIVYDNGLAEFSKYVKRVGLEYKNEDKEYEWQCIRKISREKQTVLSVKAENIINLLVDGVIDERFISLSLFNKYTVMRDCVNEINNFLLEDGRKLVILHSDLANGKTVTMMQLQEKLALSGDVYYLDKLDVSLADDLENLTTLSGNHFIFYENYNQLIDSEAWNILKSHKYSNIKYIFTSRSYINDNFYLKIATDLQLNYNSLAMYDLNSLSDSEINAIISYLDEYDLWGSNSTLSLSKKIRFINKTCKREIKNILLEVYKSKNVINKIEEILNIIIKSSTCKDVLLIAFICEIMAINIKYDDIETILGYRINKLYLEQYREIKELVLVDDNIIKFKSSSIATHVIANNDFNNEILQLVCKMVNVLSRHIYEPKNITTLKLLISFSNLRIIFNRKDPNINKIYKQFYEVARKTQFFSKNQFFWIQYAIAMMEAQDYSAAEVYLNNASAYVKEKYVEESYQIESLRARLLLEKTMYKKDTEKAFDNFKDAHKLICSNKTPERHYPYRQASCYADYYNFFYKYFTETQKVEFMFMCMEMKNKMEEYLNSANMYEKNTRNKSKEIKHIKVQIERIINKMKDC